MTSNNMHNASTGRTMERISILLVDDHSILRSGLQELFHDCPKFEVVGEAESGRAAVEKSRELSPDVLIMDISMPDLNGIEATRQISAQSPETKIIVLSIHSDRRIVAEVFRAGASGYLTKDCDFDEMVSAIHSVVAGRHYLGSTISKIIGDDYRRGSILKGRLRSFALSQRERAVLQLIAEGKSTKEMAFHLGLSVKTIETYRRRIMQKLDIHSVPELTKYAIRAGLTSVDG